MRQKKYIFSFFDKNKNKLLDSNWGTFSRMSDSLVFSRMHAFSPTPTLMPTHIHMRLQQKPVNRSLFDYLKSITTRCLIIFLIAILVRLHRGWSMQISDRLSSLSVSNVSTWWVISHHFYIALVLGSTISLCGYVFTCLLVRLLKSA